MNVENSQVSRSVSEANSKIISSNELTKISNILFPLFDHLSQNILIPTFFHWISLLFVSFQLLVVTFWAPHNKFLFNNNFSEDFVNILSSVVFFKDQGHNDSVYLTVFIGYSVVFALILFFVIFSIVFYYFRRRFLSYILYPTKFFLEVACLLMIHPMGFLAGVTFSRITESSSPTSNIPIFIFSLLYFVLILAIYFFSNMLLVKSAYLAISPFASFDSVIFVMAMMTSSVLLLLEGLFNSFPDYSMYFLIVIHFLFFTYFYVKSIWGIFFNKFCSIIFSSVLLSTLFFDVLRIVFIFIDTKGSNYVLLGYLASIVVSLIITIVIFFTIDKTQKNRIASVMSDISVSSDESNRFQSFDNIKLNESETRSIQFLFYIIQNHKHELIDFHTIKYIIQNHHTPTAMLVCLRILSYFPGLTSFLSVILPELNSKRELSIFDGFLLYQIQRIKISRTSATSTACASSLRDLNQMKRDLQSSMAYFWEQQSYQMKNLYSLTKKLSKLIAFYNESLSAYANSMQHYDSMTDFLIECKTDYKESIKMYHKKGLAEVGNNMKVDVSFARFVQNFKEYLKLNILGINGKFVDSSKHDIISLSASSYSVNYGTSSSTTDELDLQYEESLGKQLFAQTKLRIALQNVTNFKRAFSQYFYIFVIIITFLLGLGMTLFFYINFRKNLDSRGENRFRVQLCNLMRWYIFIESYTSLLHFGEKEGWIVEWTNLTDKNLEYPYFFDDTPKMTNYKENVTWQQNSIWCNVMGRGYYESFTESITNFSNSGKNLKKYCPAVFEKSTTIAMCSNTGHFIKHIKVNFNVAYAYVSFAQSNMLYIENSSVLYSDKAFCTVFNSSSSFLDGFESIFNTMAQGGRDSNIENEKNLRIIQYVAPVLLIIINIVIEVIAFFSFKHEIQFFLDLLLALPSSVKSEAALRIYKMSDESSKIQATEDSSSFIVFNVFIIMIIVSFVGQSLIIFFEMNKLVSSSIVMSHNRNWSNYSRKRKSFVVESLFWIFSAILYGQKNLDFLLQDEMIDKSLEAIDNLENATNVLMSGDEFSPSALDKTLWLDQTLLTPICNEQNQSSTELHEMYRCASSSQLLSIMKSQIVDTTKKVDSYNGKVSGEFLSQITHMLFYHILPLMNGVDDALDEHWDLIIADAHSLFDTLLPFSLILVVLNLCLNAFLLKFFIESYQICLIFIRRIQPLHIINNEKIASYLLDEKNSKQSLLSEMSLNQRIMHDSHDSIICIDSKKLIEMVNPAVSETFGYTPDQLLGQSFTVLMKDKDEILNKLDMMEHKQIQESVYEDHVECLSDEEEVINCLIEILAMEDHNFVIILKDESEIIRSQKEAEDAKKQSENLLYQILPREIVTRLNSGEKDISFSIPCATIMFIDIVKFSEYSSNLSPSEIMSNLSLVFGMFDTSITKYDLLIKIKLIGDVYMCAGGLFDPDIPPLKHAEQMIKFAFECLQNIEDANIKLSSNLNVRIGVNTDGPLIAGVLGTDKPTFDIIGDPINVSSRLQSTDIPSRVQISQNVADLLKGTDFIVEQRGEIMLKGKGQVLTFLVSPPPVNEFSSNDDQKSNVTELRSGRVDVSARLEAKSNNVSD